HAGGDPNRKPPPRTRPVGARAPRESIREQNRVRKALRTAVPRRERRLTDRGFDAGRFRLAGELARDGDLADLARRVDRQLDHRRALVAAVAALRLRGGARHALLEIGTGERLLVELGLRLLVLDDAGFLQQLVERRLVVVAARLCRGLCLLRLGL